MTIRVLKFTQAVVVMTLASPSDGRWLVIGPSAINDEAFMEWSQVNKALELVWNTSEGTVSIPLCKLQKTECRVHKLLEDGRSTRRDFNSVLGVMRHVSICFPPARAFYQLLHVGSLSMAPFVSKTLSWDDIDDLRWCPCSKRPLQWYTGGPNLPISPNLTSTCTRTPVTTVSALLIPVVVSSSG
ncbi:hypothetical protein L914_13673 [Phytophthora nicotianae]|uniref:Uncharacterized protein n=1 Tax=Phytophthora nicotianae TaxID=4792 RepID=W2MVE7_PHYNI|nr:hypothetical protein L914_13673 [Phytophthora nicotianae]